MLRQGEYQPGRWGFCCASCDCRFGSDVGSVPYTSGEAHM